MNVHFTEEQIHAKAVQLGMVTEGEVLLRHLRSRVVAALIAESAPRPKPSEAPIAERIVVQPGSGVDVDGRPFPWLVQADRIEVTLQPDGSGMVRLTLPAKNVQITQPVDESE